MKTVIKKANEIRRTLLDSKAKAEAEGRNFTEEEKAEHAVLLRELSYRNLEIQAGEMQREASKKPEKPKGSALVDFVRDAARSKQEAQLVIRAEGDVSPETPATVDPTHMTSDLGPIQPLTIEEIVEKVEEKLIWTLLGIQMPTGLAGNYEWPIVGDVEATFAGEGVEIEPTKIDISKVAAVQQRVGITMALTRESIFNSRGKIENLVRTAEPHAIAKAINRVVLSPTKVEGQSLQGPFVTATAKTIDFTFKGFNLAKAALLAKGYDADSLVWVMSEAVKAELEATPKDAGSGIMTIEDGKLCGRPVFTCSALGEKVGLGDFRYQVVGQFGNPDMVVDPYSKAKAGKVEITLNANFGTATLDKEAFMILTKKA